MNGHRELLLFIILAHLTAMCITQQPCSGVYQNIKNGHCYRRFCDHQNFTEANQACVKLGGHLPYVRDKYEDEFLFTLANGEPQYERRWPYGWCHWIGLKRDDKKKFTKWLDGSPLKYQNWAPQQPDYWKNEEECVHYAFDSSFWDQWNDVFCGTKLQYFCEWESCKLAWNRSFPKT